MRTADVAGEIDSLQDLVDCLEAAVRSGQPSTLEFGASLLPQAGTIAELIDPTRPSFTIAAGANPLIQPGTNDVMIVGEAALFPGQVSYEVAIKGTVPAAGTVVFDMAMSPADAAGWTFRGNFPPATGYFPPSEGFDAATQLIGTLPSVFDDIAIGPPSPGAAILWASTGSPNHRQGLTLDAILDATKGSLATHLGDYLPGASALPLKGSIEWTAATFAILSLESELADAGIPRVGPVVLRLGTEASAGDKPAASTAAICGNVALPGLNPVDVCAPVLAGSFLWALEGRFDPPQRFSLGEAMQSLVAFAGADLTLPQGLANAGQFALAAVEVGVAPAAAGLRTLRLIGVEVQIDGGWQLPLTGLTVDDVEIYWRVVNPLTSPVLSGQVNGSLYFGPASAATPRLAIQIDLTGLTGAETSSFAVSATLDPANPLTLSLLFKSLTGLDIGIEDPITVVGLDLEAHTDPRFYFFYAGLENSWQPFGDAFQLQEVDFSLFYSGGGWTSSISATIIVAALPLRFSADYRGAGNGWRFEGALLPTPQPYTLGTFVAGVLPSGWAVPSEFDQIELTSLSAWFDSKTGESGFATSVEWSETFFGRYNLVADAAFSLQHLKDPATGKLAYSGSLAGQLQINALTLGVVYPFGIAGGSTITFTIAYRGATLTAVKSTNAEKQDILAVNLGGVSFGDILGFLVGLADPGANYRLPSPWDALYGVSLDGLTLTVNTVTKEVGVRYQLGLELGFAKIDTVSLTYHNRAGQSGVDFAITGRFGTETYGEDAPLAWDVLNDPPPTPAGKGEALLDLRFVGLGQNVGFTQPQSFASVADVVNAMEAGFAPAGATGPSPLALTRSPLAFTGDGRWLIGADFTVAEVVSLQIVFNDPALYGLHVSLSGAKAKKLAGLDFEILYKKVTDTIGVYHIDLTLPTAMRQLDFGAVSITLPTISLDIYTNGNFYVDCGYPVNMDFSKSACVQAATFTGYGGFYFGVLDGATSNQVPKITNGTFSPVIEIGLALSVGLGRTFNKGVLQAGLTVSLAGSVQGVFAWFEPTDKSLPKDMFYRVIGTAELRGHVYGVADFVVVSARVDILAYAKLTLTVESYQPILIEVTVGVEVEASIKIVFFTVHFSFSTSLDFSFTIGSATPTPWIVSAGGAPAALLAQQRRALSPPASAAAHHRRLLARFAEQGTFDWSNMPHDPVDVPLVAVIGLTVTKDNGETDPSLQAVLSLFAESSVPRTATRAGDIRRVETDDPAAAPFNRVAAAMLRWALDAYTRPGADGGEPPSSFAMEGDLQAILDYLKDKANWRAALDANLETFLADNLHFRISSPQAAGAPAADGGTAPPSVSVFPIIPALTMTGPTGLAVDFAVQGPIGPSYEDALAAYYQQLTPTVPTAAAGGAEDSVAAQGRRFVNGPESLSSFIFRDYFAMVAKGAADSALAMLKSYPYLPTGASLASAPTQSETLQTIAGLFPGPALLYETGGWESLATVGGRLGVPLGELRSANPGLAGLADEGRLPHATPVAVPGGATPRSIVEANPNYPLQFGLSGPGTLPLNGIQHQVLAPGPTGLSESIDAIAGSYGLWGASLFAGPTGATNVANAQLLAPGASFWVPAASWGANSGLNVASPAAVAGFFAARSLPPPRPEDGPWYELVSYVSQYLQSNNADLAGPTWAAPLMGWTGATGPSGASGTTPILLGTTVYQVQGRTAPGPSMPARDTPDLAAAALALSQLQPVPQAWAYQEILSRISRGPSGLATPAFWLPTPAGASLGGMADRFGLDPAALAGANASSEGFLQPLAVLALPTVSYVPQSGDTFGSLAAAYDLTPEELADSLADVSRLLAPAQAGQVLGIPDLPGRPTDQLIEDLAGFGRFNDVSGMVSRFLMHGMRVPQPATGPVSSFPPDVPLSSLYALDGQQFAVPTGPGGGPTGFSVSLSSGATWASFEPPTPSGPTGTLSLAVDSAFLAAHAPAGILGPSMVAGPGALPLYVDQPRHYPLQHSIHWQSAGPVGLTGSAAAAGQPSLWPLPPALKAIADATTSPTGPAWGLFASAAGDPTGASATPIERFAWGSAIVLRLHRVRDPAGQPVPNVYQLMGSDAAGKDILLQAWQRLGEDGQQIFIAYPPAVASNNNQGLASEALDLQNTVILKAGLSTVTHSGAQLRAGASAVAGAYSAPAATARSFLKLAWEASVTAQGGFYLIYRNAAGNDLPAALFGGGDDATVRLILVSQDQGPRGLRWLQPFNNVAVIGENVPAHAGLFVRAADPKDDIYRSAAVAPGNAGFFLARTNPDPAGSSGPLGPSDQTRSLFHLTGCRILDSDGFDASNRATPVGPLADGDPAIAGPTGPGIWRYRGVYPVSKFGKANACPSSAALPAADANPYRGIGGTDGKGGAEVEFELAFYDVFGNETEVDPTVPSVRAPVGYTDEIIGIPAWPGAGAVYAFAPEGGGIVLETRLSLQPGRYAPGASYSFAQSSQAACADAARYAEIFYQVQQPDYRFTLSTNLGYLDLDPLSLKASFTAFVTKALVYCRAAETQQQCVLTAGAGQKLAAAAEEWRVDLPDLVLENRDRVIASLVTGPIAVPAVAAAAPSRTLADYAAGASMPPGGTYPPACAAGGGVPRRRAGLRLAGPGEAAGPARLTALAPSPPTPATAFDVATWNLSVPLSPGLTLKTPTASPPPKLGMAASLDGAAQALGAAVYATIPGQSAPQPPFGLYWDNLSRKIIAPDVTFVVDGKSVTTVAGDTFADIKSRVGGLVSDADLVAQIRSVEELIAPDVEILSTSLVVPPPERGAPAPFSLAALPADWVKPVAEANQWTGGFFAPGQPLYLGYSCVTPDETDSFASVAAEKNVPIEALAWANGQAPLNPGATMAVPGLTRLDPETAAFASYSARPADSLDRVAAAFGLGATGPATIAALIAELPGLFADGAVVAGPAGATALAGPADSLASVATRLGTTAETIAEHIKGVTGLYRPGAALLGPLPRVPGPEYSPPIEAIAAQLNIVGPAGIEGAAALLDANRSLDGFLRTGAALAGPTGATRAVALHDTVSTILAAFGASGPSAAAMLAAANAGATGLLTVGAGFLPPPHPTLVRAALAPQIPPAGRTGAEAIAFPVAVSVGATREPAWVNPDFTGPSGATAVYQVAAGLGPDGAGGAAGSVDLRAFADGFETAFLAERLKCAVSQDKDADPDSKIWALNLGPSGASGMAIQAGDPAFYALAPLSTTLMNGSVPVAPYQGGGLGPTAQMRFASVDLDAWMLTFAGAVDMVLGPQYGAAAYRAGSAAGQLRSSGAHGPRGLHASLGDSPPAQGPSAFNSIVAAKQAIARGLTGQVTPILEAVGTTYGAGFLAARDTFYQRMEERLADAWSVSAVVGYPVSLSSPCAPTGGPGPYPPRLVGRIVPDLYTVPPGATGTLAAAAASFGVAPPQLAMSILDVRGLLAAGATAEYGGKSHLIKAGDSLATLAAEFGVDTSDWAARTGLFDNLAPQPLLAPGAELPAVRTNRAVQPGDDAGAIAQFFGVSPTALLEANEGATGIYPAATTITVGATSQPIGDRSLLEIATAANWSMDEIAGWAAASAAPLSAGTALSVAAPLPEFDLSSTKIAMSSDADGETPLAFALSLKRPERFKSLFLNLKYVASEVEHDIFDVDGTEGYQSSSWLSLVRPLGGGGPAEGAALAMAQVQVPIPLRFYPTPPSLLSQAAAPFPIGASGPAEQIRQGREWDYNFDLRTDNAAQDTTHIDVRFNVGGGSGGADVRTGSGPGVAPELLFPPLAQFISVWPALSQDLALLLDPARGPGDPVAAGAVDIFAQLCTGVASAFDQPPLEMAAFADGEVRYRYRMIPGPAQGASFTTLTLVNEDGASGPWPRIFVQVPGDEAGFKEVALGAATGATAMYAYAPPVPAEAPLVHRFTFPGLDVIAMRNGWGGAWLSRNDDLIASGPLGAGEPPQPQPSISVAPQFIYQTPDVRFIDPLTPFLDRPDPIDVSGLTGPSPPPDRSIEAHLYNMFAAVLAGPAGVGGDPLVSALVGYGYQVTPGGPTASMPVLMLPAQSAGPDGITPWAQQLGTGLRNWRAGSGIDPGRGALVVDLTLFAQPLGASAGPKPLLEFEQLNIAMASIDWDQD